MSFEENIKNLKINLPDAKAPVGSMLQLRLLGNYYLYQDKYLLVRTEN